MRGCLDSVNSQRVRGNISAARRRILMSWGYPSKLSNHSGLCFSNCPHFHCWPLMGQKSVDFAGLEANGKTIYGGIWGSLDVSRVSTARVHKVHLTGLCQFTVLRLQASSGHCSHFPLGYAHQNELLPDAFPVLGPTDVLSAEWPPVVSDGLYIYWSL